MYIYTCIAQRCARVVYWAELLPQACIFKHVGSNPTTSLILRSSICIMLNRLSFKELF
jgi:hypothetical protein